MAEVTQRYYVLANSDMGPKLVPAEKKDGKIIALTGKDDKAASFHDLGNNGKADAVTIFVPKDYKTPNDSTKADYGIPIPGISKGVSWPGVGLVLGEEDKETISVIREDKSGIDAIGFRRVPTQPRGQLTIDQGSVNGTLIEARHPEKSVKFKAIAP